MDTKGTSDALFRDGVLMDIDIAFWAGLARNSRQDVGLDANAPLPGFVVGLGTKRLIPEAYVRTWRSAANRARYALEQSSFRFPVGGARFVPTAALAMVERVLTEIREEFEEGVRAFLDRYEAERDAYLAQYPEHRDRLEACYPPRKVVESRFGFTWQVYAVSVPEPRVGAGSRQAVRSLEHSAQAIALDRYRHQLQERLDGFLDQVVASLRAEVVEATTAIIRRVEAGEVVTEKSLGRIRRLVERYRTLDFIGDSGVQAALDRALRVIGSSSAREISDDTGLRQAVREAVGSLRQAAAEISDISTVTGVYRRRIDL